MMTVDISHWDETICNMTACQHPPCWEAIRRIEKGQPRILVKDLNSLERHCPEREDELPTLKIFDLPLNYSYRGRIKHPGNSSPSINVKDSGKYCTSPRTVEAFVPPLSVFSPERNLFPGLNSRVESHPPHYTPISLTSLKQVEKIQVTDLGDLAALKLGFQPAYGNLIVKWIPDMRHKLLLSERPTKRIQTPTQKMCVKELALEGILSFKNSKETCYPNLQKRKKPNKVPTGGQPYLLHLRRHPKIPANKSRAAKEDCHPSGEQEKRVTRQQRKGRIPN
ncbi:uncharacterized protein C9orf43 homolog [Sphaerodactylus townsendi]|uniref:uncharacterized protein C9orf43 homolog n=1 Tax=Sphaerodactylus townsendi TaxID=933632 RepID=UPI002027613F|nr:uncharacterized protein C9orf43 homolog [Sphaerodactylus townsendi]